jgi:hypothetical protein
MNQASGQPKFNHLRIHLLLLPLLQCWYYLRVPVLLTCAALCFNAEGVQEVWCLKTQQQGASPLCSFMAVGLSLLACVQVGSGGGGVKGAVLSILSTQIEGTQQVLIPIGSGEGSCVGQQGRKGVMSFVGQLSRGSMKSL